jgi:hypothetical protein
LSLWKNCWSVRTIEPLRLECPDECPDECPGYHEIADRLGVTYTNVNRHIKKAGPRCGRCARRHDGSEMHTDCALGRSLYANMCSCS